MEKQVYNYGTGRRKLAIARVRIMPGNGAIVINGVPYEEYFPREDHRSRVIRPLAVTESKGKFNVTVKVVGGGITGQSTAISHGIARALVEDNESRKTVLRQYGLLTRDARIKERKKPGLKRARKAPQYTKR